MNEHSAIQPGTFNKRAVFKRHHTNYPTHNARKSPTKDDADCAKHKGDQRDLVKLEHVNQELDYHESIEYYRVLSSYRTLQELHKTHNALVPTAKTDMPGSNTRIIHNVYNLPYGCLRSRTSCASWETASYNIKLVTECKPGSSLGRGR